MSEHKKDNPIKRYKLTADQERTYQWIKDQKINTDDNTICYWVKVYSSKRIREVIDFANMRRNSGQEIQNIGGWINKFLKSGQAVVTDVCRLNYEFSLKFKKDRKWEDLKIFEKYVKDRITGDDLPLTIEVEEFKRCIEALYQKSQLYK